MAGPDCLVQSQLALRFLAVDTLWALWLVSSMDLGEFSQYRTWLQIGVPIAFVLTLTFVDEFLAVRALGMLALLAAEPILSSAFLRPEAARLLLVVVAYLWLTLGLFWVRMSYVLRDQIHWLTKNGPRSSPHSRRPGLRRSTALSAP